MIHQASELIDGANTKVLDSDTPFIEVIFDGTNWQVLSEVKESNGLRDGLFKLFGAKAEDTVQGDTDITNISEITISNTTLPTYTNMMFRSDGLTPAWSDEPASNFEAGLDFLDGSSRYLLWVDRF